MLIARNSVWEYQFYGDGDGDTPADPFAVTVPTTGWTMGLAPFGFDGGADNFPHDVTINTEWTPDTSIWIRRNIVTNGRDDVLVTGHVDDACYVYVDGVYVGACNPGGAKNSKAFTMVLPKELLTQGTHQIAILAVQVGPPNPDEGTVIYIEGDYLPPLVAWQPQAPVVERLEWLTDINNSKNGTEERFQVRVSPVQTWEYSYPANADRKQGLANRVWGSLDGEWLVPVWSQARYIGAVAADQLNVTMSTLYGEFAGSSLALLWESEDNWQVLAIDAILTSSTMRLFSLTRAFTRAYLMPLREAIIPGDVQKRLIGMGYHLEFTLTFRVLENFALTVANPTQYLGDDVYTDDVLLDGDDGSDTLSKDVDLFDPGNGLVEHYTNWLNSRVSRTQRVLSEGLAENWTVREFLHRRAGRCKGFWQPSFEDDLRLTSTGTLTATITVLDNDYERFAVSRTHIAFELSDGTWMFRSVVDVDRVGDNTLQITLNTALSIAASRVRRVSWLGLKRLNTDRVEIRYIGNNVAQTEFRTLEIAP